LGGSQNPASIPLLEKNPEYLIVGICLGMQTMNVATGGTLVQDIPLEIYKKKYVEDILKLPADKQHRNYASNIEDSVDLHYGITHPIKVLDESWFYREGLIKQGQFPAVVSSHHQGIEKPGLNFRITATSMDGKIPEAIDHIKFPHVYGFQFHPEVSAIYSYENIYHFSPDGKGSSLRSVIEQGNGYEFNKALWARFAKILNDTAE